MSKEIEMIRAGQFPVHQELQPILALQNPARPEFTQTSILSQFNI
jgi:hypothetical protein